MDRRTQREADTAGTHRAAGGRGKKMGDRQTQKRKCEGEDEGGEEEGGGRGQKTATSFME